MKPLFIVVCLLSTICFADEQKQDHLPIKFHEAQDIIAKRNIDGKAKHWWTKFLDMAARDRRDGNSGVVKKYPEALTSTTAGEKPVMSTAMKNTQTSTEEKQTNGVPAMISKPKQDAMSAILADLSPVTFEIFARGK